MAATRYYYVIPKKEDGSYLEKSEDYARKKVNDLCNSAPVRMNAKLVRGTNIITFEYKFVRLLDEGYKCFLLGLYYSTVSLCSVATERVCYDILEKAKVKLNDKELEYKQKKPFFKIPFTALIEFLNNTGLISEQMKKDMNKINDLRQKYVHPVLEGDAYQDALQSLNLLCKIIDSFSAMNKNNQV